MSTAEQAPARDAMTLLDTGAVDALPWLPLRDIPGVQHKVLWQQQDIAVGLIRLDPGAREDGEAHWAAHHHLFVLDGDVTVADRPMPAGSYAHIPPGVEHPTVAGERGATLLYQYRPQG